MRVYHAREGDQPIRVDRQIHRLGWSEFGDTFDHSIFYDHVSSCELISNENLGRFDQERWQLSRRTDN
jgi:hypothetical protein